jgi:hypothetical protein
LPAGYVELAWGLNPEPDLSKYQVYRAMSAAGPYTPLQQGQQTLASIHLKSGSLVVGQLTVTRMTLDEIVAAGIDINAPENQFVYKFQVHLAFNNTPLPEPDLTINGEGDILVGGDPISFPDEDGGTDVAYPEAIPVPDHPEVRPTIAYLAIPGDAHWLKEFFDVGLTLENTADPQFVVDNSSATLQLQSGLSLAPTSTRQSLQVALGSIAPAYNPNTARSYTFSG